MTSRRNPESLRPVAPTIGFLSRPVVKRHGTDLGGQGSRRHSGRRAGLGPFLQPQAPEGAPNVLMIVWDDVGYGAFEPFGGPIETPTMCRIADNGVRYSNFHTTALCSPTRSSLLNGRNATSNNGLHHRGVGRFPGILGPGAVRERHDLRGSTTPASSRACRSTTGCRWRSSPSHDPNPVSRASTTSTTPTPPTCPNPSRSTFGAAPTRSPPRSASRRPKPKECSSRRVVWPAGTACSCATVGCTMSTTGSANASRRSARQHPWPPGPMC